MTGGLNDGCKRILHDVVRLTSCPSHAALHAHPSFTKSKRWCCKGLFEEIYGLLFSSNVLWVNLPCFNSITQHGQVSAQVFALSAQCNPLHQMHRNLAVTCKCHCILLTKHVLEEVMQLNHLLGRRLCRTKLCCTTGITSSSLPLCLPR